MKKNPVILSSILFLLSLNVQAQIWKGVNVNSRGSFQINLKSGDKKNGATEGKPKDSERYKLGYLSNDDFAKVDMSNLFEVAKDFFIDIGQDKKQYPPGYGPQWNFIGSWGQATFEKTNFLQNRIKGQFNGNLEIAQFNGKAYIYISNFLQCSCAAPLMQDNENVVINNEPKVFYADNFRKIASDGRVTNEPCKAMTGSFYDEDGWQLKLTLSVDGAKTLHAVAILESLTNRNNLISNNGTNVTSRWTNSDLLFANNMTPQNAFADINLKKKNAADALAQKEADDRKEKERAILDANYEKALAKLKLNPAATPKTILVYKGYNLKEAIDIDKIFEVASPCIIKAYTNEDRIKYKKFIKDTYKLNARLLNFDPNAIDPHERDQKFSIAYLSIKAWNDILLQLAARHMVCDLDIEGVLLDKLIDIDKAIDREEGVKIWKYLESKP